MVIYQALNQARVTDRDTVEIKKSAKKKKNIENLCLDLLSDLLDLILESLNHFESNSKTGET